MVFKELLQHININNNVINEFKATMVGFKAIMLQNYIKVLSYSKEKIVIKCKNDFVTIEGENFSIKEMGKTDIIITGIIKSIVKDR